ncbi:phage terminase large subunit [Galactobacter valiniphilus]|uniref:phage terminase large subunit n=1 Tax=Galactobacter valiniphilus TaxID=2676122 RepID=UPI003737083D
MTTSVFGLMAQAFEKPEPKWATPGALAAHLNPKTVQTPALDLIDAALVRAFNTPDSRLIISMPPQEGKSVRAAQDFPTWALTMRPDMRIVTASYAQSLAERNGQEVRDRIRDFPELGLAVAKGNGGAKNWRVADHAGGLYSIGVSGGLTGQKADMLIIDDPHKDRAEANSKTMRERVWGWVRSTAFSRLSPGAPVIVIMTRWHEDDLVGRLLAEEDGDGWEVINIPAQADHRPEKGETDPLGREPGEFMVSARKRTAQQWEQRKRMAGPHEWGALYQGRPTSDGAGVFPRTDEWARYDTAPWIPRDDGSCWVPGAGERLDTELIQSWDLTFKDANASDFVVGQVWLRVGATVHLLDMVRARMNFPATVEAVKAMRAKWPQAGAIFIEDKANGPAVIASLNQTIPGIVPVEPRGGKVERAAAVSPFVFSRNVVLPSVELLPNVAELLREAQNFPNDAHDDTVDAMSQAVDRLLLAPLLNGGGTVTPEQVFGDDFTPVDFSTW